MAKHIDADKLKTKVKKLNLVTKTYEEQVAFNNALAMVVEIITSLQQEQPEEMLDKTLDDAAEEYAFNNWEDNDYHTDAREGLHFDAIEHTANCFKAGAKWMARQGMTKEAVIGMATKDIEINVSQRTLDALGLGPDDKVIVQIRKKEG